MQGTRQGNVFLNGSKVADIYITQLYLYGYCVTHSLYNAVNLIKYAFTLIICGLCADCGCSVRLTKLLTCLPDLHSRQQKILQLGLRLTLNLLDEHSFLLIIKIHLLTICK